MKGLVFIVSVALLSACAGTPKDPNERAQWFANATKSDFEKGSSRTAVEKLEHASTLPGGAVYVRQLLTESPAIRDLYSKALQQKIADLRAPFQVIVYRKGLDRLTSSGVLPASVAGELRSELSRFIQRANESGAVEFLIDDDFNQFPELGDDAQSAIAFERTLKALPMAGGERNLGPLLTYVGSRGPASPEARRLAAALPHLNVRAGELEGMEQLFPEFVAQRRKEVTVKVFLAVKNADRLFADDLRHQLERSIKGVIWLSTPDPGAIHLTVEKVRSDEQVIPEKSETVTYSQADVNFLSAALLMPRNASYQFDLVIGGFSLDYGYVVTARGDLMPPLEKVVRGKVEAGYRKCQNARIQNVFGGATRADFVANDNMKQRCSGPDTASMEELRQQVLAKISSGVLEIPRIQAVHLAN